MATEAAVDTVRLKLQIVVDKKKNRVLFAEAEKDFVDFIFHILALPLGAVARVLTETSSILGSVWKLREGLKNLDAKCIESHGKDYLLNAVKAPFLSTETTLLLPEASYSKPPTFYRCRYSNSVFVQTPCCSNAASRCCSETTLEGSEIDVTVVRGSEKGYVNKWVTFMVMDDLTVRASLATSVFSMMNELSIKDVGAIEKREVTFGYDEAVKLLKASLNSKTVLTDVFLAGAVKAEY